jgi:hypothetical protein
MDLVTTVLHELETLRLPTDILEGWFHGRRGVFEFLATESTGPGEVLVASLADVVGLGVARGAEVLVALLTPDSVVGHVLSRLLRYHITHVVSLASVHFARHHLHDVPTLATYEVLILLHDIHDLPLLDGLLLLLSEVLVVLPGLDHHGASGTLGLSILRKYFDAVLPKTIEVTLVPALGTLEHGGIPTAHIPLGDLFVAKPAHAVLLLPLQLLVVGLGSLSLGRVHEVVTQNQVLGSLEVRRIELREPRVNLVAPLHLLVVIVIAHLRLAWRTILGRGNEDLGYILEIGEQQHLRSCQGATTNVSVYPVGLENVEDNLGVVSIARLAHYVALVAMLIQ